MKNYWWVPVIIVFAVGGFFFWKHIEDSAPSGPHTVADNSALPGIQSGNAPWNVETAHLKDRLIADGLPVLTDEGTALHTHTHLDIFVNGAPAAIPADIGYNDDEGYQSPLHTESADGVIHVESPIVAVFTLGQFFDAWGVRFSAACIGGYCADGTDALKVWIDGQPYSGDPRTIQLREHQEIVIAYGSTPMKDVPRTYSFEEGE